MNDTLVVMVRAVIAFFSLLIFARVLGKQTISQLTYFDYVLGITIGSIAATLTTDLTSRAWAHWVGLLMWALLVLILQVIVMKWRKASKYLDGEPTIIIMKGKIMEDAMTKLRYTVSDLMEQLRVKGVFDIQEVEYALLEVDGEVSVLKKAEYQNLTPKDLNLKTPYKGLSKEVIYDGRLIEHNLKEVKKSKEWLADQLRAQGFGSYKEVFLAVINPSGHLFVDGYDDQLSDITEVSGYEDLE